MAGEPTTTPMRIGIIGTGNIGSALAELWVGAGHTVFMSSRHPEELAPLAEQLGERAQAGTVQEAAEFGDIILLSVPYAATPQIGRDFARELAGKIVVDTGNPVARRDGDMAGPALAKSTGVSSQEFLPRTRVVRAFNCIGFRTLRSEAHRKGERIAIPLAGDDGYALAMAQLLVTDAGFDGVIVGGLASSRLFELGKPLAAGDFTASEMKSMLNEYYINNQ
ncbi:MAG: NAD(P)-binding domain-containing protein [Gammaproteobacteria bacterium]|nr:NAD(P)-binding domain-containing protein [Gammaproteobacteria bacterium]